jgi:hypothetical protein
LKLRFRLRLSYALRLRFSFSLVGGLVPIIRLSFNNFVILRQSKEIKRLRDLGSRQRGSGPQWSSNR